MKNYRLLLFLLLYAANASAQVDPDGLVLYLPFNGNANDESSNHYNVLVNGPTSTTGVDNKPNTAFYFDGISNSITVPDLAALDGPLKAFTILIRMMPMGLKPQPSIPLPYGATYNFLTWHRYSGDSTQDFLNSKLHMAWQPPLKPEEERKEFLSYSMTWCSGNVGTASGYLEDSARVDYKWITIALVYNEGNIKVFHNCTMENKWENIYPPVSDLCGSAPMQISLGNVPQDVMQYGYRYFKGKIDELRIYKRALTDDEVSEYADTTCKEEIIPVVNASISAVADPCKRYHYSFTDNSTSKDFILEQRKWVIDNGDSLEQDSLDYTFNSIGNHTVQLILQGKDTSFNVATSIHIDSLKALRFLSTSSNEINVCENSSAKLQVSGGKSYNWQPCRYLSDCNSNNPVVTPEDSVSYMLHSVNDNGCIDSLLIKVKPVKDSAHAFLPTAFTPNGDGRNDAFGIISFQSITGIQFTIYNIFGQPVFTGSNKQAKWNGKYRNIDQPTGTYIWTLRYQSGNGCHSKMKNGTVELIR